MQILRMSLVRCREGCKDEVEELFQRLDNHYATFPGYVLGFRFDSPDRPDEAGRLAVWESHEAMDKAARHEHTLAIRSQINLLMVSGEHEELVYNVQGTTHNLPAAR